MIEDKTSLHSELLYNRLIKRFRHLKKWAKRMEINSYRLYDRDIPEIPLVLDLYDDAVSGAIYIRPEETEKYTDNWLNAMKAAIEKVLGINGSYIFIKERREMKNRQYKGDQYEKISRKNFYRDAKEGDLFYRVNLSDYLDTGLFLDSRKKRALLRSHAGGKKVLNLFAYTSTLSVAAAKGGAAIVDSVDLSKNYLEWGRINFALNKLKADFVEEAEFFNFPQSRSGPEKQGYPKGPSGHKQIRSDVLHFLGWAEKMKLSWDIILLDPPSFSNSKKMTRVLDIKRDYIELIKHCLSILNPGGKLWFSANIKGFKLNAAHFPGYVVKDMGSQLLDEDFKGKKIPACYTLEGETGSVTP